MNRLPRKIKIQLLIFAVVTTVSMTTMALVYLKLPAMLFGVGRYTVTVHLAQSAGLYETANVTYNGTEVGRVAAIKATPAGAEVTLSLKSGVDIPSDLDAQVHSQSAIGEQYVALRPRDGNSRPLRDGDVITVDRTAAPPDINDLLDATNTALQAIPNDNLKTVIDESYTAVGGLGPQIARIVNGSTALAIDAKKNLGPLTTLIDQSAPLLDSQTESADAVTTWAAHLATITAQLRQQDSAVAGILDRGGPAASEVQALIDRLQPTLPLLLANLVSVADVAITYRAGIEQILVLLPQGVAEFQGIAVPQLNTKQDYKGGFLSFNANVNLPAACTTGYLPAAQRRTANFEDYPDRPAGELYCRIPQDSPNNVRGARNIPCETRPGKRAPTVKMCESDEHYVPLNDGTSWKGDPNATLSGQGIPQVPPSTPPSSTPPPRGGPGPSPPPIAAAEYDPATGAYVGPDGKVYTQTDLANNDPGPRTWQTMLLPEKPSSAPK
ncbi:MCE family protein [Rhodococcus erythropolis]|uniref:MCE family protein n=1 Tax=Rhodococcus erythropolis TaxID=1833 RepID=UPI001C9B2D23|nr:MlaD family protein [Rhodococcus erythropolis]MBY6388846.1 MCE family protein [Rhodococcus erythropolis]